MTTRVLLISEDPTRDPYIALPVLERIFADLAVPARIEVLHNPHIRGVDQALNQDMVGRIVRTNRMTSLFILLCDRDCNRRGNQEKAQARQSEHPGKLIAAVAVEELEVWMLALHKGQLTAPWKDIRTHCDPKEAYADQFLKAAGLSGNLAQGYKRAMANLGRSWGGLQQLCPEIAELKAAIGAWVESRPADRG